MKLIGGTPDDPLVIVLPLSPRAKALVTIRDQPDRSIDLDRSQSNWPAPILSACANVVHGKRSHVDLGSTPATVTPGAMIRHTIAAVPASTDGKRGRKPLDGMLGPSAMVRR